MELGISKGSVLTVRVIILRNDARLLKKMCALKIIHWALQCSLFWEAD